MIATSPFIPGETFDTHRQVPMRSPARGSLLAVGRRATMPYARFAPTEWSERVAISFSTRATGPFEAIVDRVEEALTEEGFGVLSRIDVQATLKAKLDQDIDPYLILGACNPPLASKAIAASPSTSTRSATTTRSSAVRSATRSRSI